MINTRASKTMRQFIRLEDCEWNALSITHDTDEKLKGEISGGDGKFQVVSSDESILGLLLAPTLL